MPGLVRERNPRIFKLYEKRLMADTYIMDTSTLTFKQLDDLEEFYKREIDNISDQEIIRFLEDTK